MVYVNAGDSKGQQGKVLKVDAQKQRAIVEGVNISKKATKPNAKNPQGGIIEQESAIHISNLQVLDPKSGKPTRIGRKQNAAGKLVRFAKKSGEERAMVLSWLRMPPGEMGESKRLRKMGPWDLWRKESHLRVSVRSDCGM